MSLFVYLLSWLAKMITCYLFTKIVCFVAWTSAWMPRVIQGLEPLIKHARVENDPWVGPWWRLSNLHVFCCACAKPQCTHIWIRVLVLAQCPCAYHLRTMRQSLRTHSLEDRNDSEYKYSSYCISFSSNNAAPWSGYACPMSTWTSTDPTINSYQWGSHIKQWRQSQNPPPVLNGSPC